jgi:hypothetical protein
VQLIERQGVLHAQIEWLSTAHCSREIFFVGTRNTDDGDAGGIAEEV